MDASTLPVKEFDGIIVGGGGSGMMASLQLAKSGMNTAVVSKVFPTRSIPFLLKAASLVQFKVQIQMMTGDGICLIQSKVLISLEIKTPLNTCAKKDLKQYLNENMGLPFSRTEEGKIYQRAFGGQSKDYGKGGKPKELVLLLIEQAMLFCIHFSKQTLRREPTFFQSGLQLIL